MIPVYAQEDIPSLQDELSIFLVGPTPRSPEVESWRKEALAILEDWEFDGYVFVPEPRDGKWLGDYIAQTEWEREALERCDIIVAWVCRDLETLPGFTTNVEFGMYVTSGRFLYGRPEGAPKTAYLDWLYTKETGRTPIDNLQQLLEDATFAAERPWNL